MSPHAHADHRYLANLVVVQDLLVAQLVLDGGQGADCRGSVIHRQGKGEVRTPIHNPRGILHNHVDIDVSVSDDLEDLGSSTHRVRKTGDGDLGLRAVMGHPGDNGLFHVRSLRDIGRLLDPGAGFVRERGTYVHWHVLTAGVFDATQMEDFGTASGHFEHLLVGDLRNASGTLDDPWISSKDTVDVRVDLTKISAQGAGQGDRSGVRRPPP